jgi:hypothetical protein
MSGCGYFRQEAMAGSGSGSGLSHNLDNNRPPQAHACFSQRQPICK